MSRFLGEGSWIKSVTTNSKLFCDPSMIAVCTASVVTAVFLFHVHLTRNPTIEHSMHTNHQKSIRIVDENDDKGKTTGSKRGLSRSLSKSTSGRRISLKDGGSFKDHMLSNWVDIWVGGGTFPCLQVSIIKEDEEIFYHAAGYMNKAKKQVVDKDTIFRIYSMTKPITALAILILVDRGLLSLHDSVSKYIPSFANTKVFVGGTVDDPVVEDVKTPITIHHLLTHTSGLTYGIFGNTVPDQILKRAFGETSFKAWFSDRTNEELCDILATVPLSYQPGTAFLYSLSLDVLGRVIEVVSNQTLREFFTKEIFQPLNMSNTDFYVNDSMDITQLAEVYEVQPGNQCKVSTTAERQRDHPHAIQSGGGGLVSTITDYTKFVIFLTNRCQFSDGTAMISSQLFDAMTSNQLPDNKTLIEHAFDLGFCENVGKGIGFGYGMSVVVQPADDSLRHVSSVGEFGWGGVASTWFAINPNNKTACVLMANLIPSSANLCIRYQLRTLLHYYTDKNSGEFIGVP